MIRPERRAAILSIADGSPDATSRMGLWVERLGEVARDVLVVTDDATRPPPLPERGVRVLRGAWADAGAGIAAAVARLHDRGVLDGVRELVLCDGDRVLPVGALPPALEAMADEPCDAWTAPGDDTARPAFAVLRGAALRALRATWDPADVLGDADLARGTSPAGAPPPAGPEEAEGRAGARPLWCLERGCPIVEVEALREPGRNLDGIAATLAEIEARDPRLHALLAEDPRVAAIAGADAVRFSVVMATRNRADRMGDAIRSVLAQEHPAFEMVVVDDGSDDGTAEAVRRDFAGALEEGRLRLLEMPGHVGVCRARNAGLALARHPWIAHIDSDNAMRPHFLRTFAEAVAANPEADALYGRFRHRGSGKIVGPPFDRRALERTNFIDLGVFVHRRSLVEREGGFDPELRRLVDWDLALRYTRERDAVFVPSVVMDYEDGEDEERISRKESLALARVQVARRSTPRATVSTLIPSYQHEEHLRLAIESALMQKGDFQHEIVLADDGSTDGTPAIVEEYCLRHPARIRSVSSPVNRGISANFRAGFQACGGEFLAMLEGDDYWSDERKLEEQVAFLRDHPDSVMVFHRLVFHDLVTDGRRQLLRQKRIEKPELGAEDFLADDSLNLIVNFSTCMYRSDALKALPAHMFEIRLSEITLAFHLDRIGRLGWIPKTMSVYQKHDGGAWSGATRTEQLRSGLAVRRAVLEVARPELRPRIEAHIAEHFVEPLRARGEPV